MKHSHYLIAVIGLALSAFTVGCGDNQRRPPVNLTAPSSDSKDIIEIPYTERSGVKMIPVRLNGVTMDMMFDTGASGISISLNELVTMYKNGQFSNSDFIGVSYNSIADGSIVENGRIRLREVAIGDKDPLVLHNVEASVMPNLQAPVLLGNNVIDKVASFEVDNVEKVIRFRKH